MTTQISEPALRAGTSLLQNSLSPQLLRTIRRSALWLLLLTRGGGHQMLHEAMTIRKSPLLHNLSSDNFVDGSLMDGHLFAVRGHTCELASLGSSRCKPDDDAVTLGNDV